MSAGDDRPRLALCPNCVLAVAVTGIPALGGKPGVCVAGGETVAQTVVVHSETYRARFCPGHAVAFLLHGLRPADFQRVAADAGGDANAVYHLHDDFYVLPDGLAINPVPVSHRPAEMITAAEVEAHSARWRA